MGYHPVAAGVEDESSWSGSPLVVPCVGCKRKFTQKIGFGIDKRDLIGYIIYRTTSTTEVTMNIKNEPIKEKGILESLCEGFGLLASYVMVFVLLWEGILGMAGAK